VDAAPDALARAARALGGEKAGDAPGALWDLAHSVGAPTSLAAIGFDADDAEEAADIVAASPPQNPRPVDRDSIRELLLAAHAGRRP
jgi:alcohol dehydrogenase class IV